LRLRPAENLITATQDTSGFLNFSSCLKNMSARISKICNDLRLLSSGPRCGLGEINLPAVQPGSSIMPGKVNPVIPEVVNQTAFYIIGNDYANTFASEAGQMELNAMEPIMVQ
jgi:aspartate ammonia-lyase